MCNDKYLKLISTFHHHNPNTRSVCITIIDRQYWLIRDDSARSCLFLQIKLNVNILQYNTRDLV